MPAPLDKSRLRNALRKLRQIPFDQSEMAHVAMAPQDMLDFLAMLAGIKPVYLLGRGFDDPGWVAGVSALGRSMGLRVISGGAWLEGSDHPALPHWFNDVAPGRKSKKGSYVYICKSRDTAAEVEALCSNRNATLEQEARLLGYPLCCVQGHYEQTELTDATFSKMLLRHSGGDVDEMKRLVREDVQMEANEEESAELDAAHRFRFVPFTNVSMCKSCEANLGSPARRMSATYQALATAIDPDLSEEISYYAAGPV